MCNCTCDDEDAFGPQRDHEVAALVFIVLMVLACGIFLAWPALTATCCPPPAKTEEEVDLALSLLQMGDQPRAGKPRAPPKVDAPVVAVYDGTGIAVHEMHDGSDSSDEDNVVGGG